MGESKRDESVRIAHLTMLQGVISRMWANSFSLKALSAAFGSAIVAVIGTADQLSPYYGALALIPIVAFWLMDAKYLRIERAYRILFDHVREGKKIEIYSLDASPFMKDTASVLRIAVTWSTMWFYVAILSTCALSAFFASRGA